MWHIPNTVEAIALEEFPKNESQVFEGYKFFESFIGDKKLEKENNHSQATKFVLKFFVGLTPPQEVPGKE